jgi:hypothetical protein
MTLYLIFRMYNNRVVRKVIQNEAGRMGEVGLTTRHAFK